MSQEKVNETVEEEVKEETSNNEKKEVKEETKKEKVSKHKEEIEKLNAEITKLKNENAKMKDDYLRARADMENTKKRLSDENIINRKYASMKLVEDLINPVDMLVKVSSVNQENPELANFLIGFKMISGQLLEILKNDGLQEIDALNKPFDPTVHHAISKEHKDGVEKDIVIEVLQTGYKYKDRILKPAMVKVSE